mmetsp:Transcript_76315/g.150911  ORF Transcript_76315/g.150911 Transcript_76315/m.150911 type:complete len:261 (+) Transcript_76315:44-826(+)
MGASIGAALLDLECCTRRVKAGEPPSLEDKDDAFLLASLPGSTRTSSEVAEVTSQTSPPSLPGDGHDQAPDIPSDSAVSPSLTRVETQPNEADTGASQADVVRQLSLRSVDTKASENGSNVPAVPASPGDVIGQIHLQYRSLTNWFNSPPETPMDSTAVDDKTMASTAGQTISDHGPQWLMGPSLNKWYSGSAELPEHQESSPQTVPDEHCDLEQEDSIEEGLIKSRNLSHFYELSEDDQPPQQQADRSGSFKQLSVGAR